MTKQLNRNDDPPDRNGELWVLRLKGNTKRTFTIVSTKLWGVRTHWNGKRTVPCFKPTDSCEGCKKCMPQRWKGYLHAFDGARRGYCFLELTPEAARQLLAQFPKGFNLRGQRIEVERTSSDQGRLHVNVLAPTPNLSILPPEMSPKDTLLNLWEVKGDVSDEGRPDIDNDESMAIPA
jgi:hypothetical protein